MLFNILIIILLINLHQAYAQSKNNSLLAKSSKISESILSFYILVIYNNNSKSLKSISGVSIIGKDDNKYYTRGYKSVPILDMTNVAIALLRYSRAIYGNVKYKNWDSCERDSVKFILACLITKTYITRFDFISARSTKYAVNCKGNLINYNYYAQSTAYCFSACALIDNNNNIYDRYDLVMTNIYRIDISHLNVVSHTQFTTISGTVYYLMFQPCSSGLFKLVCILTNENPTNNDFLKSNNELFDVKCSGTYITSNIYNNADDKVLSCGIIDENRTYLFVYDIYNSKFEPKIDLKKIKMRNSLSKTNSHIKGTIKYKNWNDCSKENSNYRLKCYGSYDEISKSDLIKGDIERINCDGNNIDMYVKGNGTSVYFGCGITTSNGITIYTYEVKKFINTLDFGLIFKMLGCSLICDFLLFCFFFICALCCLQL